jgi:hypothetical protein
MSLMVRFGNKVILNTDMNNFFEEIKRTEWTENKTYRNATKIEVKPINALRRDNNGCNLDFLKIQKNKEIIDKLSNCYFSQNTQDNNSKKLNDLITSINNSNNKNMTLTRKRNYENLIQTLKTLNIENNDLVDIKAIDEKEIANLKNSKFLEYILKYKNLLLKEIPLISLSSKEKSDLIKFLDSEERKSQGIHDINDYDDFHNINLGPPELVVNPPNLYHSHDDFNIFSDLKREFSNDKNIGQDLLVNDFKKATNAFELPNENILMYLQVTQDLTEAAKLYYEDIYNTLKLSLTYVYPSFTEKKYDFSVVGDPSELIVHIYNENPNVIDPKLFLPDGKQLAIPESVKFIGGLKLAQNSKLIVKY